MIVILWSNKFQTKTIQSQNKWCTKTDELSFCNSNNKILQHQLYFCNSGIVGHPCEMTCEDMFDKVLAKWRVIRNVQQYSRSTLISFLCPRRVPIWAFGAQFVNQRFISTERAWLTVVVNGNRRLFNAGRSSHLATDAICGLHWCYLHWSFVTIGLNCCLQSGKNWSC